MKKRTKGKAWKEEGRAVKREKERKRGRKRERERVCSYRNEGLGEDRVRRTQRWERKRDSS